MNKHLTSALKYILSIGIAVFLFWNVYQDIDFSEMFAQLSEINYIWVVASIIIAVFSHLSRGARWVIALRAANYHTNWFRAFLAVMIGYMANLFVPRMGEVARCSILKRTDGIPFTTSFGIVLTERVFDLIMLVSLTTTIVLLEYEKIGDFLVSRLALGSQVMEGKLQMLMVAGATLAIVGGTIAYLIFFRGFMNSNPIIKKLLSFVGELKTSVLSIRNLTTSALFWYLFHTVAIWILYFGMAYALFFTMPETSELAIRCALTTMIMGGIGIVIPTPGGVGSYHLFVSETFKAYDLAPDLGKSFAFLMHTTQTLSILIVGLICFVITFLIAKKTQTQQELNNKSS